MPSKFLNMKKRKWSAVALFVSLSSSMTIFSTSTADTFRAVPTVQYSGNVVYSSATVTHGLTNLTNLHFLQMVGLKGTIAETTNATLAGSFRARLIMKHPFSVRVNRSAVGHAAMNAVVFIIGKQSWFSTWVTDTTTAGATSVKLGTCAGGPVLDVDFPTGSEATACNWLGEFYVRLRNAAIADADFTTHFTLMSTTGTNSVASTTPSTVAESFYNNRFTPDYFVEFSTSQTTPITIPSCPLYFLHLAQANLTATQARTALTKWQLDSSGHFICIGNYAPAAVAGYLVGMLTKAILEATPAINQNLAGSACNNLRGDIQVANNPATDMVPTAVFDLGAADAVGLISAAVVATQFSTAANNIAGALFRSKWTVIGGRALAAVQLYDGGPTFLTGKNRYGALLDTAVEGVTVFGTAATARTKLWTDWATSYGTEQTRRLPGGAAGLANTKDGHLDWLTMMMGAEQSHSNVIAATAASVAQADKDQLANDVAARIATGLAASNASSSAGLYNVYNYIGATP